VLINPATSIGNRHTFSDSVLGNKVMSFCACVQYRIYWLCQCAWAVLYKYYLF